MKPLSLNRTSIPNWITLMRIFLGLFVIAFLGVVIYYYDPAYNGNIHASSEIISISVYPAFGYWLAAGAIFAVAALSDFVDGFLARHWKVESTFGKILDPIADKILINVTMIMISYTFHSAIPIYLIVIFVLRDLFVDGIRIYLASRKIIVPAHYAGKWKTVWQIFGILVVFFLSPFVWQWTSGNSDTQYAMNIVTLIPLYLAALFSIMSGFVYFAEFYQVFKYHSHTTVLPPIKDVETITPIAKWIKKQNRNRHDH